MKPSGRFDRVSSSAFVLNISFYLETDTCGCSKLHTYKKGVSLILRESLVRPAEGEELSPADAEKKICITDNKATARERVGDTLFEYTAGSFF